MAFRNNDSKAIDRQFEILVFRPVFKLGFIFANLKVLGHLFNDIERSQTSINVVINIGNIGIIF